MKSTLNMENKPGHKVGPLFDDLTMLIGIDPGVNTGVAIIQNQRLARVESPAPTILGAMDLVAQLIAQEGRDHVLVIWEDARLIGGMHGMGRGSKGDVARLRGVGSVHRDCSIWGEFFARHGIKQLSLSPKAKGAKLASEAFSRLTGWSGGVTNEHSRDAAMLIWPRRGLSSRAVAA